MRAKKKKKQESKLQAGPQSQNVGTRVSPTRSFPLFKSDRIHLLKFSTVQIYSSRPVFKFPLPLHCPVLIQLTLYSTMKAMNEHGCRVSRFMLLCIAFNTTSLMHRVAGNFAG